MVGSNASTTIPYRFNDRFKLPNSEYVINSEVVFKDIRHGHHEYLPKDYRSFFGWNFAHNGVIYDKNVVNLRLALRRHLAERLNPVDPYDFSYDRRLRENQRNYIADNKDQIIAMVVGALGWIEHKESMVDEAIKLMTLPHPKRRLRENDMRQRLADGGSGLDVWIRKAIWKMKVDEFAKPEKWGRIIVDLGVSASLQGAPYAQYCKDYLGDKVIVHNGHAFYFATHPQPSYIKQQFIQLMTHSYKSYFLVFSDDCACSIMDDQNEMRYYNADISSCDCSHEEALFHLLFELFRTPPEIEKALIGQIMARIQIRHPHNKNIKVNIEPKNLYLQSGITITTLINVLAWLLIFHSYVEHQGDLITAAQRCGYTVTTDACSKPQHIQFLKMSPMLDLKQEWQAVLNLGVILRCSGVCRGDLPGSGDVTTRAKIFQSKLMNGVLKGIDYPPIHNLNPKESTQQLISYENIVNAVHHNKVNMQDENFSFNTEQFYSRYDLSDADIIQLEEYYRHSCFGSVIYSSAAEKVFKRDYGLELPKEEKFLRESYKNFS